MLEPHSTLLEAQQPSSSKPLEAEPGASLLPNRPSPLSPNTALALPPTASKEFNYSSRFTAPAWCLELASWGWGEGTSLGLTGLSDDRLFHQDPAQEGDSWPPY